jgi:hypothetical protein
MTCSFVIAPLYFNPKISRVACLAVHGCGGGDGIMNPRRFVQVTTALCGTVGLAGWVVASLTGTGVGSVGIENAGAVSIEDHTSRFLIAEVVDAPQATASGNIAVASADVAAVAELVTGTAADATAASDQPKSIVEAALPDSSQVLPPETPPVQVATANTPDPVLNDAKEALNTIETLEECLVADICIDRFLWALYQRAPKEDTIKVHEEESDSQEEAQNRDCHQNLYQARRSGLHVEGSEGGGKSRHADDGLRDRRHGSEL